MTIIPLILALRSANVVTQNNSATLRPKSERLPSPHRISILFLFGGKIFEFGMGDGARSGFFKEETAKTKCNRCLRSSYHIVSCLKEYTLGIRLGNFR